MFPGNITSLNNSVFSSAKTMLPLYPCLGRGCGRPQEYEFLADIGAGLASKTDPRPNPSMQEPFDASALLSIDPEQRRWVDKLKAADRKRRVMLKLNLATDKAYASNPKKNHPLLSDSDR